jgi:alpha-methylacyl-CoA racemase
MSSGPLQGIRVVEFASLGPAPFACMLLSDLGAEVLRIDRPNTPSRPNDLLARGRSSVVLDLKTDRGRSGALDLIEHADVLVEGLRPGVMERLGVGPSAACAHNPRLIFTRVTGWGQSGPLAQTAGHDINYIALAGVLGVMGPPHASPVPPLNLVGDFAGGALYAALGVAAALFERCQTGKGQVIDAAMVDGAASMMSMLLSHKQGGRVDTGIGRGAYFLDGSAPYYRCYECSDGRFVAVGAIEPAFWAALVERLGHDAPISQDFGSWGENAAKLATIFLRRSRDEWVSLFSGSDSCVTPVLSLEELRADPHLAARATYVDLYDTFQPNVAPRLSRTPGRIAGPPATPGKGGLEMVARWKNAVSR